MIEVYLEGLQVVCKAYNLPSYSIRAITKVI